VTAYTDAEVALKATRTGSLTSISFCFQSELDCPLLEEGALKNFYPVWNKQAPVYINLPRTGNASGIVKL
jgi:hypothetical protein